MRKFTEKEMEQIWYDAYCAGIDAGSNKIPTPMNVQEADLSGNPVPGSKVYHVPEGVCGFAWVIVKPGNSRFARFMKRRCESKPHYYGGVCHWIRQYNQSYERKMAHAEAFAEVLRKYGINAYADGRLD